MSVLKVESLGVAALLDLLKNSTWLVPSFQRDFVWSESDVTSLVQSVIEARPIGMATLWEQPDDSALELEPVSIDDLTASGEYSPVAASLVKKEDRPKKFFAILDGRQRCTAIAVAFGGLRATNPRKRFSGRYFLDVTSRDTNNRIKYLKDPEIRQRGLQAESVCIANGLFPLASLNPGEELFGQWMRYLQAIYMPANYPNSQLPPSEELLRRDKVLKDAFHGINQTLLAVYVVPQTYSLGDICEIFETLNTTGTRVSTIDLLHSWLYSDTIKSEAPIELREWIDDLGDTPGAEGWASSAVRPELVAQIVTASYISIDSAKPTPRTVGRKKVTNISSLKAGDLLATPPEFWKTIIGCRAETATYIRDFQQAVICGRFSMAHSPYPVTVSLYVALRWYMAHEPTFKNHWTKGELDALFRAFFWRNAVTSRYDQGFLTQIASDLRDLKTLLFARSSAVDANAWANETEKALTKLIDRELPSRAWLVDRLTDSRPQGALGKALMLPLIGQAGMDLLDASIDLKYPNEPGAELHHIYPKDWCRNNNHGELANALNPKKAGRNYVDSIANLMPLSRESNIWWKAQTPAQALQLKNINFDNARARFEAAGIDKTASDALLADPPNPATFWNARGATLAERILRLTAIEIQG